MSLHGLRSVTIGVPNVNETAAYYADFGLVPETGGWFSTTDAGRQLRIVPAATRRLVEMRVGVDDQDDLARAAASLERLGVPAGRSGMSLETAEPVTGTRVFLDVAARIQQPPAAPESYNGPGRTVRADRRAPGFSRPGPVRPRKLGHAVLGSTDYRRSMSFFTDGLGFKISDRIAGVGAFMRCSTDHHNVLVLAAPVNFLHHTSWQVDDVDEVGRGGPTGPTAGHRPSSGPTGSSRVGSGTWWSARWTRRRRSDSSPRAWGSRSATGSRGWPRSCGARPIITTCWCSRHR